MAETQQPQQPATATTAAPAPVVLKEPVVVAPEEVVALYEKLLEREWNPHNSSFKNPSLVARSVLQYGLVTARRLVDAFTRIVMVERRVFELEAFQKDMLANIDAAQKQFAEMQAVAVAAKTGQPPAEVQPAKAKRNGKVEKPAAATPAPVEAPKSDPAPKA